MENETIPQVLKASKTKAVLLLIISLMFCIIAYSIMIKNGHHLGWLVMIFFSLGFIVGMILLIPNSSYLKLTLEGFEIKSLFKKNPMIKWEHVEEFHVSRIGVNKMVVFNFSREYKKSEMARNFSRNLAGVEGALPETYGKKANDLAKIMNEWKEKNSGKFSI